MKAPWDRLTGPSSRPAPLGRRLAALAVTVLLLASVPVSEELKVQSRFTAEVAAAVAFLHVPKTGGSSLASDLRLLGCVVHGGEACASFFGPSFTHDDRFKGMRVMNVTMLRQPRSHVLSQYMMCAHASPWISELDRPSFLQPSHGALNDTHFNEWLRFFTAGWHPSTFEGNVPLAPVYAADWVRTIVDGHTLFMQPSTGQAATAPPFASAAALVAAAGNKHGDWDCYNPRNMQTRQLSAACTINPHHIYTANFELLQTAEALDSASAELGRMGFVGIMELYPLSLCLILHALGAPELPPFCHDAEALAGTLLTHEVHGVPRYSLGEVSPATLALVDALTAQDAQLYAQGRRRLLGEYDKYQRLAAAAGRRLLGDHLLQAS